MGTAAIPIVLLFLLILVSWRMVFFFNKDLVRAKAWGELARRSLPFAALTLMALTVLPVQTSGEQWALTAWAASFAVAVVVANLFSMPFAERRANKAFRKGDYERAVEEYRKLVGEHPLARHHAFLAAALGAGGDNERSLEESGRAVEIDPEYGIAYYNRALVLRRMGHRGRAKKDLNRALEADLPRRLKPSARRLLEELS